MALNGADRPLAKLAYGALFCLVLPVLLVLWARAQRRPLPGVHAPVAGGRSSSRASPSWRPGPARFTYGAASR
jgi:hypothetical protein